jgi:hypothetical protein
VRPLSWRRGPATRWPQGWPASLSAARSPPSVRVSTTIGPVGWCGSRVRGKVGAAGPRRRRAAHPRQTRCVGLLHPRPGPLLTCGPMCCVLSRLTPEQPRQHRSAADGAGVGCAGASLLRWYAGQHLINVLTASGVAGLAAGTADAGTAHGVFALFEDLMVETDDPRMDISMAVTVSDVELRGRRHPM